MNSLCFAAEKEKVVNYVDVEAYSLLSNLHVTHFW